MRIAGYLLERRLDAGGRHEVWLARGENGQAVALKRDGVPLAVDPPAEHLAGLVPVLESGIDGGGRAYQIMPLVPGMTLADRLAEGPLDPVAMARIMATVARTLDLLHAGRRAHGDIRPANIMLAPDGTVTLLDREERASATPEGDRRALEAIARAL